MKKQIVKILLVMAFAAICSCAKPSDEGTDTTYEQFNTLYGDSANNGFFK